MKCGSKMNIKSNFKERRKCLQFCTTCNIKRFTQEDYGLLFKESSAKTISCVKGFIYCHFGFKCVFVLSNFFLPYSNQPETFSVSVTVPPTVCGLSEAEMLDSAGQYEDIVMHHLPKT